MREEELTVDVLRDEDEYTHARKKTTLYQVESVRKMVGEYDVSMLGQEDIKAELERASPKLRSSSVSQNATHEDRLRSRSPMSS